MLNEAQQKAVISNHKRILCLAGAGTGKTHCMIERISRLVSDGVDPSSILALTFTNAAAFEMKDRYKKKHPTSAIPEFRTFHSFCYSLIATNRDVRLKLGYTSVPVIADDSTKKRIDKQAGMQVGVQLSQKKMSGKEPLTELEKHQLNILEKARLRLMKAENVITFDMLCGDVCKLFINNDDCIKEYISKYRYIFVDEFQDTDNTQFAFVQTFKDASIFVVGDALQSIYSFRGANSDIIKDVAEDKNWEVIKLYENYRSTSAICNYANAFSSRYASDVYRIAIKGQQDGSDVETRTQHTSYYSEDVVPKAVLSEICEDIEGDISSDIAIIARTNKEVGAVQDYLTSLGIDYVSGKQDSDAIHILKSTLDNDYMMDWLSTFLQTERYSEYIRLSTINSEYGLHEFIKDFGRAKAVSDRVDKISCVRNICRERRDLKARCQDILTLVNYPRAEVDISNVKTQEDFLTAIISGIETTKDTTAQVYVGTIHSVKGLEYDTVYVIGVNGRSFRLTNEDNNNLFYVAVTRAKNNLIVYKEV